jgi:hypothetical protein
VVARVAISSSCFAQVPYNNGFFAHIDGRWTWLGGDRPENALVTDKRTTSGPGGQLMIGYKIADTWDVSLAGDVQAMITSVTQLLGACSRPTPIISMSTSRSATARAGGV